jgi:hypothetical protein
MTGRFRYPLLDHRSGGSAGRRRGGGRRHRRRRDLDLSETLFATAELRRLAAPGSAPDAQGHLAAGHRTGKAQLFHQQRAEAKGPADLVILTVTIFYFRIPQGEPLFLHATIIIHGLEGHENGLRARLR